jgi:hypothetical protein
MQPYFYADDFEASFAPADKKVRQGFPNEALHSLN